MAKLLMNSMYGRFGMKPSVLETHIWNQDQIDSLEPYWELQSALSYGELYLVSIQLNKEKFIELQGQASLKNMLTNLSNKTNVAIAAAVTAYSRIIINQFKLEAMALGLDLYYSDTDSLVLSGELPSEMIDSATLGKLKLEHKIKEGIFVMPDPLVAYLCRTEGKVYYLETTEGSIVTKCKGFSGKLTRTQYLELLSGNTQELEVTKWQRSLKESYVKIERNQSYNLRFSFNKREQIFDTQGRWVDTKPLIINQKD